MKTATFFVGKDMAVKGSKAVTVRLTQTQAFALASQITAFIYQQVLKAPVNPTAIGSTFRPSKP